MRSRKTILNDIKDQKTSKKRHTDAKSKLNDREGLTDSVLMSLVQPKTVRQISQETAISIRAVQRRIKMFMENKMIRELSKAERWKKFGGGYPSTDMRTPVYIATLPSGVEMIRKIIDSKIKEMGTIGERDYVLSLIGGAHKAFTPNFSPSEKVGYILDIIERKKQFKELRSQSKYDEVTKKDLEVLLEISNKEQDIDEEVKERLSKKVEEVVHRYIKRIKVNKDVTQHYRIIFNNIFTGLQILAKISSHDRFEDLLKEVFDSSFYSGKIFVFSQLRDELGKSYYYPGFVDYVLNNEMSLFQMTFKLAKRGETDSCNILAQIIDDAEMFRHPVGGKIILKTSSPRESS